MDQHLLHEIPSLDLAQFTNGNEIERKLFIKDLGNAFNNIGFVAIKNHGLSDSLVKDLYQAIQIFFFLPDAIKQKYEIEGLFGQRGYTGKGKEHAKGRSTGDLMAFMTSLLCSSFKSNCSCN
jgi:isopenicillin N synthase-like dioxygenase